MQCLPARSNSTLFQLPCPCCGLLRYWESWLEDTRTKYRIYCVRSLP